MKKTISLLALVLAMVAGAYALPELFSTAPKALPIDEAQITPLSQLKIERSRLMKAPAKAPARLVEGESLSDYTIQMYYPINDDNGVRTKILSPVDSKFAGFFGVSEFAPTIEVAEDGAIFMTLGEVLYSNDTHNYVLTGYDEETDDLVMDGIVNLYYDEESGCVYYPSMIGVFVTKKEDDSVIGYFSFTYGFYLYKPNATVTYEIDEDTFNIAAFVSNYDQGEFTITAFTTSGSGYPITFTYAGNKAAATNQTAYWSQTISEDSETGTYNLFSYVDNALSNAVTATISNTLTEITFDTDWTIYASETGYYFGFCSPATITLDMPLIETEAQQRECVIVGAFNGWADEGAIPFTTEDYINYQATNVSIDANVEFKFKEFESWSWNLGYNDNVITPNKLYTLTTGGGNMHFEEDFTGNISFNMLTNQAYFEKVFVMPTENVALPVADSDCPVEMNEMVNCILKLDDSTWVGFYANNEWNAVVDIYTDKEEITLPGYFYYIENYSDTPLFSTSLGYYTTIDATHIPNLKAINLSQYTQWICIDFVGTNVTDLYLNDPYYDGIYVYMDNTNEKTVTIHIPAEFNSSTNGYQGYAFARGDEESGLPEMSYSNYRVRLADGTVLGLYPYDDGLAISEIYSENESVVIPAELPYMSNDNMLPVYSIGRGLSYNYYNALFQQAQSVKSITIPASVYQLYINNSYTPLAELHMEGEVPNSYWTIGNNYTVYVKTQEYYYDYKSSWTSAKVLPEGWDFEWITIDVAKAGEFAQTYLETCDNDWSYAKYLKVTGKANATDISNITQLTQLMKLDLSELSFTSVPSSWLQSKTMLIEVKLPATVTTIGSYAFAYCSALKSVIIEGDNHVSTISNNAFYQCYALEEFDLSEAQSIGASAFYSCRKFQNFSIPKATALGNNAFQATAIASIGEGFFSPQLTTIPSSCFYNCPNLTEVNLEGQITAIKNSAFNYCNNLSNVILPSGLTALESNAFANTAISEISLPSSLTTMQSGMFGYCNSLTDLYCHAVMPPTATGTIASGVDYSNVTLHVPALSVDMYREANYWSEFYIIDGINEPISSLYIDRVFTIDVLEEDAPMFANRPTLTLANTQTPGQLTVEGEGAFPVSKLYMEPWMTYRDYGRTSSYRRPTLINHNPNFEIDAAQTSVCFYNSNWYFISFPYDVNVSDIIPSADTYWAIRKYDSYQRSQGNSSATWVNLTTDDVMKAGVGYIVSAYNPSAKPVLVFPSVEGISCEMLAASGNATIDLIEYEAEFSHNRSWNLVGNPYPAYYDLRYVQTQDQEEFTTPLTIWRGNSYTAYSAIDDEIILLPNEAFFIQKPEDGTEMVFSQEGRMTYADAYEASPSNNTGIFAPALNNYSRNVFNFNIDGNESHNRCRIVLNECASTEYEISRDALKFISEGSPLIYVAAEQDYEICERPFGNGEATIGFDATDTGIYTLSLTGRFAEGWTVILTDNLTGQSIDLTEESTYTFSCEAGSYPARFGVAFYAPECDGISAITGFDADANAQVYNLAGVKVYEGRIGDFTTRKAGVYMISVGDATSKVILK